MDKRGMEEGRALKMTGSDESGGNRIGGGGGGGNPSQTPKPPKPGKPAVKPPPKGTKTSKGA